MKHKSLLKKIQSMILIIPVLLIFAGSFSLADESEIEMAITVDDLPATGSDHPELNHFQAAVKMIETFKKHGVQEVYGFVNGINMKPTAERSKILTMWKAAGFKLANHTYSHFSLSKSLAEDFIENIERNEVVLVDYASNIEELKIFRYPFLEEGTSKEKRNLVRNYLLNRKYKIAQVTLDFEDWGWEPAYNRCSKAKNQKALDEIKKTFLLSAKENLKNSLEEVKKLYGPKRKVKHILLLHLTNTTADYLDELLDFYKKENVRIISLEEAMTDPIYKDDPGVASSSGATFLEQVKNSKGYSWASSRQHARPEQMLEKVCK